MKQSKVWFITGATAGLGKSLALAAANAGHLVVGTSRDAYKIEQVVQETCGRIQGLVLDITQTAAVETTVQAVIDRYGRIDVLVNNIGYGLMGAVEDITDEEAREQMETNFLSVLRLVRTVLPSMRSRQSGHVVNISSRLGITATPLMGLYAASKFALEGLSEALSQELKPFGIHVTLVEPGQLRTEFFRASIRHSSAPVPAYAPFFENSEHVSRQRHGTQLGDPDAAAQAIVSMTASLHPPFRLPLTAATIQTLKQKADDLLKAATAWEMLAVSIDQPTRM